MEERNSNDRLRRKKSDYDSVWNDRSEPPPLYETNHRHRPPQTYFKTQQDQDMIRTALQKSIYFSCLDDEQLNTFIQSVELKAYQPGQIIIIEGCIDNDCKSGPDEESNIDPSSSLSSSLSDMAVEVKSTTVASTPQQQQPENEEERTQISDVPAPMEYVSTDTVVNDESNSPADDPSLFESLTGHNDANKQVNVKNNDDDEEDVENYRIINHNIKNDNHDGSNYSQNGDHWVLSNYGIVTNMESSTCGNNTIQQGTDVSLSVMGHVDTATNPPIPPQSGTSRSIYIVRKGNAQIWYQKNPDVDNFGSSNNNYLVNTIGPGTMFGEGGFLFGRKHSASVMAATMLDATTANDTAIKDTVNITTHTSSNTEEPLECWVVDIRTFRDYVLPSTSMRQMFHKYAQRHMDDTNGLSRSDTDLFVTMNDLMEAINEYQQPLDDAQSNKNGHLVTKLYDSLIQLRLIESTTRNVKGRHNHDEPNIYLNDFCFFFALLARPDPEVDVAFLLMDENQTGHIGIAALQSLLQPIYPELDFSSQFFERYFGANRNQMIRSKSFSQFLVDLQREIGQQAYHRAIMKATSSTKDGYISSNNFVEILTTSCGWKLPNSVVKRLDALYCHDHNMSTAGEQYFSYGDFMAFQDVLGNLSFICRLIRRAEEFNNGPISADDFKVVNREFGLGGRLSRRQIDIVFDLFDLDNDGYISQDDTVVVCGTNYCRNVVPIKSPGDKLAFIDPSQSKVKSVEISSENKEFDLLQKLSTEIRNFSISALIGGVSVFLLHPIDLIKTRLMNQRIGPTHLYHGPIDCIQQVIQKEGFMGLLRGVQPHVFGVAIERSIKLQVHYLMQQAFHALDDEKDNNRKPSLVLEALAGGCAGACQLLVTNPMEITSIRLQMQGETSRLLKEKGIVPPSPSTLIGVIKDLGFPGVYRGASACLIRDVPFSAIFFPSYVACKDVLVQHNSNFTGKATAADIFYAGTIAGIPASLLTTPADVVKCRLQSLARPGEATYSGIQDCVAKMYQKEGITAFFQGSSMRVLRIAPQFGLSLLLYENMANLIGFDKARRPPSNLPIDPDDYRNAFPLLQSSSPS